MDNKNNTSLYEHTEEFPFPAMEPDKDEMFINIRNRNYATFKKEIVTLEQKATFENAKELLKMISNDFTKTSTKLKTASFLRKIIAIYQS